MGGQGAWEGDGEGPGSCCKQELGPVGRKQPQNQLLMRQRAEKMHAHMLCKTAPGMERWEKLGRVADGPLGAGGSGSSLHQ